MSDSLFSSFPMEPVDVDVSEKGWVVVGQAGKKLFEYHPELELARVVQRKRPFVVDLKGCRNLDGMVVTNI